MTQNEILITNLAAVGEDIGQELGAKMVKDYQDKYSGDVSSYYIGKNILSEILSQPGCVGVRFYNALDEIGENTLVYVGIDKDGAIIAEYTHLTAEGSLIQKPAIVGDRSWPSRDTSTETSFDWFSFS